MKLLASFIVWVTISALPAVADCGGNAESVFNCTVSGGKKQIEICSGDGLAWYSFGKPEQEPELELTSQVGDLYYLPWNGIGRSIYEEVAFQNGDFEYTVFAALDRTILEGDTEEPLSGGVVVTKGDETVADLKCDKGSVSHSLDAFYNAKQGAEQCWDSSNFVWTIECPVN